MKSENLILESVRERDIDLLFLEEWNTNPSFSEWFLNKMLNECNKYKKVVGFHSVVQDNLGKTDLYLEYQETTGNSVVLLENKINALAQDQQGIRYGKRAQNLRLSKNYKRVSTCIIAPSNYLKGNLESANYDFQITYEDMYDYFNNFTDNRSRYKAMVVRLAIEQERRGYSIKPDSEVTQFWHEYWEQIRIQIPNLYMKEPTLIPEGSDWPVLSFDWMPEKWIMRHKLAAGCIDLETKLSKDAINEVFSNIKNESILVVNTGKSYSFRIKVEVMNRHKSLISQNNEFISAVKALKLFDNLGDLLSRKKSG